MTDSIRGAGGPYPDIEQVWGNPVDGVVDRDGIATDNRPVLYPDWRGPRSSVGGRPMPPTLADMGISTQSTVLSIEDCAALAVQAGSESVRPSLWTPENRNAAAAAVQELLRQLRDNHYLPRETNERLGATQDQSLNSPEEQGGN